MKTLIFTFLVSTLIVNISFAQLNTENFLKAPFISATNTQQSMQSIMQNSEKEIVFIENLGQIRDSKGKKRPDVLFLTRSQGVDMYITSTGITYVFRKTEGDIKDRDNVKDVKTSLYRLDMEFVGINKNIKIKKELAVEQQFNYYTPEYPNGISPRAYRKITIEDIYDGIDLVYYEKDGKMKYDFVVKAGADPDKIKLKYKGAGSVYLDKNGSVVVTTPMGEIREEKPYTYSRNTGREIESGYNVKNNVVQFVIEEYNINEDIIIDPYRLWATYYGGNDGDVGWGIFTDNSGNLFVTGGTSSSNFPTQTLSGAYNQTTYGGISDAFILKFNNSGVRIWATYYGGDSIDVGNVICTDNSGALYVTGYTTSINFPTQFLTGAYNQTTLGGSKDAFILKFNSNGVRLWATYYGGSDADYGNVICTDNSGNVYVTGHTSGDFPSQPLPGAYNQATSGGGQDAFILKFNSSGARLWATYYGGNDNDWGRSICTDNSGALYVTGYTGSTNFPTQFLTGAYNQTTYGGGNRDAFILKFNSSGSRLWATYYGGNDDDWGRSICTDNSGALYVTGYTGSTNFPTQFLTGAYNQTTLGGSNDAFILKFNSSGSRLWATFYGGNGDDRGYGICTDNSNNLNITGYTESTNFPIDTLAGAYNQATSGGGQDAFILKFNSSGARKWATYYGGNDDDRGNGMSTNNLGPLYITGYTESTNFPIDTLAGAYNQTTLDGSGDAFILKFKSPLSAILNSVYRPNDGRIQTSLITLSDSLCTGQIDSVWWYVNDSLVGRQQTMTYPFRQGTTLVKLKIKDNYGSADSTTATVTRIVYKRYTNGQILAGLSLIGDSVFYAISTGDAVYRKDINGNTVLTLSVGGNVLSSCSIGFDTTVFIGSSDNNLYGFNKNGVPLWSAIPLGASVTVTPTVDSISNRLYVGVSNGNFFAINKTTGSVPVWSYLCNAPVKSSAVISSDRKLVVTSSVGTVYGFNLNLPNPSPPSWVLNLSDSVLVSPAIDSSGYFYFGSQSGNLYKIALTGVSTATIIWQIPLGSAVTSSPVIDSWNNIYVGTANGRLYSIKSYGPQNWYFQTDSIIKSTPVITSNGRIYFGNNKGEIFGLDSNKNVKFYYIDSAKISCAMLYNKGTIYFGNEAGRLFAIYDTTGGTLERAGIYAPMWGTFQNNNRRTGNLGDGPGHIGIHKISVIIPSQYALYQNYPNPFNPVTTIKFDLPKQSEVKIIVYDILGRETAVLVDKKMGAGIYEVQWNTNEFASGVYFYKMEVRKEGSSTIDFVSTKKMVVLK